MSKSIESYANELVEETLVETANTFFGARVALDEEIDRYRAKAEELALVEEGVLRRAAELNFLLLNRAVAEGFYQMIGVAPGHLLDAVEMVGQNVGRGVIPFALLPSTRYAKLVLAAYAVLVRAVEAYLHGEYSKDSRGRKRLSVNYEQLQGWCKRLNDKIDALNNNLSPSGTLCFIRGLDPALIKRQRLTEATLEGYTEELDREMAFAPVECLAVSYLTAPKLPPPDQVKGVILPFCKKLYAQSTPEVKHRLLLWKQASEA
ncbi:MAG: hypothetical protein KKE73_06110 [Proteobacteria bacterium]|nr:hypothetical protein [Pseudomonadota bacterium]